MKRDFKRLHPLWALCLFCTASFAQVPATGDSLFLIFHKQNGYIHTATDEVVAALRGDLESYGFTVETTTDSLDFTPENLARFGAVMFINTNYRNGPLLNRDQESAFEEYFRSGGGFVGVHSAVPLNGEMEESIWPWYADLFGARFKSHPPQRVAPFVVEDFDHPSTKGLPETIHLEDEWYAVQVNPRGTEDLHILATVDETGFPAGSGMDGDHPVSWYRIFEGSRAWMTLVGHDMNAFSIEDFLAHIRGGVIWAGNWDEVTTPLIEARAIPTAPAACSPGASSPGCLVARGNRISVWKAGGPGWELRVDGKSIPARFQDPGKPRN